MNQDILKEVLYYQQLSLPIILLVLAVAFILGAIHSLGPGHGKSLMAAYLIGSTGRIRDAVILALTITVSHVFSVIIVGILALWLMDFFFPEKISKWLGLFSGAAIFAIGIWLLITRYKVFRNKAMGNNFLSKNVHEHNHSSPEKSHSHSRTGTHDHYYHYNPNFSIWSNIALGISGGIVPCPKAIVILLLAISLHKITLGISIIVVFSLGISLVLVSLGIILVKAGHLLKGRFVDKRLQFIPIIGALVVIGLGIFLVIRTIAVL
ncbi:MAG: sulfite exporter TauE/SafE family protein [bacterium]|nr:MAG: sulfite exporter TauE/SafE family protein [bacterium]